MSFWYIQFSQKTSKKIRLYYYDMHLFRIVFVCFLGELKTPKNISKLTYLYIYPNQPNFLSGPKFVIFKDYNYPILPFGIITAVCTFY